MDLQERGSLLEDCSLLLHQALKHAGNVGLQGVLALDGIGFVPFFPLGGFSPLQSAVLDEVAPHSAGRRSRPHWHGCCSALPPSC